MQNMADIFKVSRNDSFDRGEVLRSELSTVANRSDSAVNAITAQVSSLTSTIQVLRAQMSTNSDFAVDAMEQIRQEFRGELEATKLVVNERSVDKASDAGGFMPGASTDKPLVNIMREPDTVERRDVKNFAVFCSYCNGEVPGIIAKHCVDCDCHFHPLHYQLHRDEWPCPVVDTDLCHW